MDISPIIQDGWKGPELFHNILGNLMGVLAASSGRAAQAAQAAQAAAGKIPKTRDLDGEINDLNAGFCSKACMYIYMYICIYVYVYIYI
jgi:hypothetical protein